MQARPKVAIVIPTADAKGDRAAAAIAQARRTTAHLQASVHVIESSGPGFRFSRSVNRGIAEAPDADAWVLLNDDCFMDEGWLDALLDTARCHPDVGVVGAVLRYPSGKLQHAGGVIMDPWPFFWHYATKRFAPFFALRRIRRARTRQEPYVGHYHRIDPAHRLDFVTGACMLITAACRKRIGGYDEDYEFSYEDIDYGLRCLASGQEIALALRATGVHLERATGASLLKQISRSDAVFMSRWPTRRVLALTRGNGRKGYHHGGPEGGCGCLPN